MVTSKDCLKKYGVPYDETTTTVNENTLFDGKHMVLWDVPNEINTDIPVLPNKIYCNKISNRSYAFTSFCFNCVN